MTVDKKFDEALEKHVQNGGNPFEIPVRLEIFNANTNELLIEKSFEVGVIMAEFTTAKESEKAISAAVAKLGNPDNYDLIVKSYVWGVCNNAYRMSISVIS